MRLRFSQLQTQLERGLAPLYMLSGEEPLQLMEAADAIRARARTEGFGEREVFHVEPGFDWGALQAASDSLSLFAERRLLELRMPTGKPGVTGAKLLQAYAERPPEDTVLLIEAGKLDKGVQNSAWYKAVETAGVAVQVWPLEGRDLLDWIDNRLRSRGLVSSREAVALIAERVEGNLLAAAQEADKLSLLLGRGELGVDEVLGAVGDSARYNVFDLGDAVLTGDARRAVKVLEGLRGEGVEPVLVLWSLHREAGTVAGVAEALARGASPAAATQKVWPNKRKPLVQKAAARRPVTHWREQLARCARVDRTIKGQSPGNPWDELVQLTLGLSGVVLFPQGEQGKAPGNPR